MNRSANFAWVILACAWLVGSLIDDSANAGGAIQAAENPARSLGDWTGPWNDDKEAALGLAVLRKDGCASLDSGRNEGSVTTRVLRSVRGPLAVNFLTARGKGYSTGWIKAELLDERSAPIPGYTLADCDELRGDSLDKVVTWKGNATLPEGRPIRLRFVMTDPRLYSFRAGDAVQVAAPPAELRLRYSSAAKTLRLLLGRVICGSFCRVLPDLLTPRFSK